MNRPGLASGSWRWRLGALPSRDVALRLRALGEAVGRAPAVLYGGH
jgi:hypothetical protein